MKNQNRVKHEKRLISMSDEAYIRLDKILENNPEFNMSQILSYAVLRLSPDINLRIAESK